MNADPSNRVRIHAWEAIKAIVGPEHNHRNFPIRIPRWENLILISEDSQAVQRDLSRLFSRSGFQVKTASTTQETIEKAVKYRPQAIIMDNQKWFDNLSGLTLTWDICRTWHLQDTVLFMLTADFIEPVFLWNGGDFFLSKFEHPHGKLAEAVNEYLHH
jgi:CheY-like chemotaxis protein